MGANPDEKNKSGQPVLLRSAQLYLLSMMHMLVAAGANLKIRDSDGDQILNYCVRLGNPSGLNTFIKLGADIDA